MVVVSRNSETRCQIIILESVPPNVSLGSASCRDAFGNPYNTGDKSFAVNFTGPSSVQYMVTGTGVASEFRVTYTATLVGACQATVSSADDVTAVVPGTPVQVRQSVLLIGYGEIPDMRNSDISFDFEGSCMIFLGLELQ